MALSEKTISKHNLKRAEVFAKHGLGDHDVAFAHPEFAGHMAGGDTDCCLCGQKHIAWQFAIRFDAPDASTMLAKVATGLIRTEAVTLKYIGSKCIKDWLDAVPESVAKLEALKRWDAAMKKMKKAMTAKVCADLCAEAGYETPEAAYYTWLKIHTTAQWKVRSQVEWSKRKQLKRNATKVKHATLSRGTLKTWLANLAELCAAKAAIGQVEQDDASKPESAAPKQAAPTQPKPKTALEALLKQADDVFNAGFHENLLPTTKTAFLDIRQKGHKSGTLTVGQQGFLASMIGWAQPSAKPADSADAPGGANFTSASAIAGARY